MKHGLLRVLALLLICCTLMNISVMAADASRTTRTALPDSSDPELPTVPVNPTEPVNPVDPTDPTDPSVPVDPTEPSEPVNPTDPTDPTDPSEPVNPTDPTDPTDPIDPPEPTEPDEPELPIIPVDPTEGYVFPNDWSRNALIFAVRNGIFVGDDNKDLQPGKNMTRAEMASLLVRLLRFSGQADLSSFRDMSPDKWYYSQMATAVEAGIFAGTSATTMEPNSPITREQAFSVLCRAFALVVEDEEGYKTYNDSSKLSAYARDSVNALRQMKILSGFEDGTLRPKSNITRAQVAQLLYMMLDTIAEKPEQIPETGFVLYRGTKLPEDGLVLDGTLLLVPTVQGTLELNDYQISGGLILRCGTNSQITVNNLKADSLTCATAGSAITATGSLQTVYLWGNNMNLRADAPTLIVQNSQGSAVTGQFQTVTIRNGSILLNSSPQTLRITGSAQVELTGTVKSVLIYGNNVELFGAGSAVTVENYGRFPEVWLAHDSYVEHMDYGLEGVKLALSNPGQLADVQQAVTLTATVTGGIFQGLGVQNGKRNCTLIWYCNGKEVRRTAVALSSAGGKDSYSKTYYMKTSPVMKDSYKVVLCYGSQTLQASRDLVASTYWKDYHAATGVVTTANVPVTINRSCYLYSDRSATRVLRTLKAGMVVYNEYNPGGVMQITCPDNGQTGWVYLSNVNYTWTQVSNSKNDYSVGTKEGFVNKKGYTSATSYMVWVSKKTQRINVYQGSAGNWKLIRTSLCSTGGNYTPTPRGSFSTSARSARWNYEAFYVKNAVVFNGGHAFHSTLINFNGTDYDSRVGIPLSHGCVRLPVDVSTYIYSLPLGTRVVVY